MAADCRCHGLLSRIVAERLESSQTIIRDKRGVKRRAACRGRSAAGRRMPRPAKHGDAEPAGATSIPNGTTLSARDLPQIGAVNLASVLTMSVLGLGRVKTCRRRRMRRDLGEVAMRGHFSADYALIAVMSGWTPMMFMTRVRL
jgi:hypothetical protein